MDEVMGLPASRLVFELRIEVGVPIDLGEGVFGHRRVVPITGGIVSGMANGRVLAAGADHQVLVSPTLTRLDAHYALELDDGARIEVRNVGIRVASAEDSAALAAGRPVPAERVRFHTTPRFTADDGQWSWLNERLFVGIGRREPDAVLLRCFAFD